MNNCKDIIEICPNKYLREGCTKKTRKKCGLLPNPPRTPPALLPRPTVTRVATPRTSPATSTATTPGTSSATSPAAAAGTPPATTARSHLVTNMPSFHVLPNTN